MNIYQCLIDILQISYKFGLIQKYVLEQPTYVPYLIHLFALYPHLLSD